MLLDHYAGRLLKVPGPRVVPQSGPDPQQVLSIGAGQILKGRESLHEPEKIGDDGLYLGLLEHHLRHPDGVKIARLPPGKLAAAALIPVEQPGLQAPDFGWREKDRFSRGRLRHARRIFHHYRSTVKAFKDKLGHPIRAEFIRLETEVRKPGKDLWRQE